MKTNKTHPSLTPWKVAVAQLIALETELPKKRDVIEHLSCLCCRKRPCILQGYQTVGESSKLQNRDGS